VALREVRECLESLGEMLAKADASQGVPVGLARGSKRPADELRRMKRKPGGPLARWSSDELEAKPKRRGVIPKTAFAQDAPQNEIELKPAIDAQPMAIVRR
jgi:hypothetical protein